MTEFVGFVYVVMVFVGKVRRKGLWLKKSHLEGKRERDAEEYQ